MRNNVLRKRITLWVALVALVTGSVYAADSVDFSVSPEVAGTENAKIKMPKQQERMALNYVNQPPMIPHSVDGYQVTTNTNRCLQCHGVQHYRATGSPRISPTHFINAQGKVLTDVSSNRYFCLQCHVPQTDAPPIVENTFKPAPGFGQ